MNKKTVALHNLGCKVNSYETEAVSELLKNSGYDIVPFEKGADIYIINTCSVTNIADRKSRQMIHRARKMNPDAIVVAMGCYVQAEENRKEEEKSADIIIGNNRKNDIVRLIQEYEINRRRRKDVSDVFKERGYEQLFISETSGHVRGFMKVQDGCDRFCSYCIIPYVRGRVRSRSIDDAVNEARTLAKGGCRELVLSGIHLSSYGKDLGGGTGLLELIEAIHEVDGISRIRLGSLEPMIITQRFVERLARLPKLCPHFHLSLQSGCDRILQAMNRRYDTAEYKSKCDILRSCFNEPSLTTDIIAGFPGETEEEFMETVRFVDGISFFETHVFPYSLRKGTKAESLPGHLTEAEKKKRAAVLIELSEKKKKAHLEKITGSEKEVLIEEETEVDGSKYWVGHTREYERVMVQSKDGLKNKLVNIKITETFDKDSVSGVVSLALSK